MAGIRVTPDQFADIVVAFLLDAMMKPDSVLKDNYEFHYILDKMERSGIKSHLLSYYLDTSSITRGKYKVVRGSFEYKDSQNTISISNDPSQKVSRDDKITIKSIVKQALKVIKSHRVRKNGGMPLNESDVDKILDKLLNSSMESEDKGD